MSILRFIIAIALLAAVEIYFILKLKSAARRSFSGKNLSRVKILLTVLAVWVNVYPIVLLGYGIFILLTNSANVYLPENFLFDTFILFPFWVLFLIIIQADLILLLIELIKLPLRMIFKKKREKIYSCESKLVLLVVVVFAFYVPARIYYDKINVDVREVELKKGDIPESLNDFRIALIADIQVDRFTSGSRLKNFVRNVNAESPDLILIAGDIITSTPSYINSAAESLGRLKSKYGIYSCVGDHDNWAYRQDNSRSIEEITAALNDNGIRMIDNSRRKLIVDDASLLVTFITNTYVEKISAELLDSLANQSSRYDLKIFLTHQPRQYLIDKAVENKYDLFLAGHTHGGQITFLFPFKNLSPTLFETKYVRGSFYFDGLTMVVTRGLGMSIAPVRYNSTPEITIIKIRKI